MKMIEVIEGRKPPRYVAGRDFDLMPRTEHKGYVLGGEDLGDSDARKNSYAVYKPVGKNDHGQDEYVRVHTVLDPATGRDHSPYEKGVNIMPMYKHTVNQLVAGKLEPEQVAVWPAEGPEGDDIDPQAKPGQIAESDESSYDDGSHIKDDYLDRKLWKNAEGRLHREDGPAVINPDGTQRWYRDGKLHREDSPAIIYADGDQEWYYDGIAHSPLIPMLLAAGATRPWHAQPEVVAKLSTPEQKKNIMRWLTRTARTGDNTAAAVSALRKIGVTWPELDTFDDAPTEINESDSYDDGSHTEITPDGRKIWRNAAGKVHRENGPAIMNPDGTQRWFLNNKLHRDDGPAVIWPTGEKQWYRKGQLHREDGPAIIDTDGTQEWYRNGKRHRTDGPAVIYPDGMQAWYINGKETKPVIPIILAAGAKRPWHRQPEVVARLNQLEEKKNIMRWLTRSARSGGDITVATTALRKIGVAWPELKSMAVNTKQLDESDYDDGSHTEITSDGRKIWKNDAGQYHRENGPAVIWPNGEKQWYRDGDLHRIGGPAIIYADGTQRWYRDGKLHREDGPAYTHPNGKQGWYQHGLLHRTDGPAIMYPDGVQSWRINDKETKPVIPILIAAGAQQPWHAQPEVVDRLNQPEQKKNILRWLTRTARIGGNTATAVAALRKIGVDWPELATFDDTTTAVNESSEYDDGSHTEVSSNGVKLWKNSAGQLHREDGPVAIFPDGRQEWWQDGKLHRDDGPAITRPDGAPRWYYQNKRMAPVLPILMAAGADMSAPQQQVLDRLNQPEIRKNINRWLTRTARSGGDIKSAITALQRLGIDWPELANFYDTVNSGSIRR